MLHSILCELEVLLTMCKGPVGQYANYTDEGMERANHSQSVKCFYCLAARADPLTLRDDPTAKGHLSRGQRASPSTGRRGIAMATELAEEWQSASFRWRGLAADALTRDGRARV